MTTVRLVAVFLLAYVLQLANCDVHADNVTAQIHSVVTQNVTDELQVVTTPPASSANT